MTSPLLKYLISLRFNEIIKYYTVQKIVICQYCTVFFLIFARSQSWCTTRYDNVTLIPLVLQLGLRIGPIQRMGAN